MKCLLWTNVHMAYGTIPFRKGQQDYLQIMVSNLYCTYTWWRHQMEAFSALLALCAGNSPHKGQSRGALMFSLICVRIHGWVSNGEAGDLRRHRAHYDVIVMICLCITATCIPCHNSAFVWMSTVDTIKELNWTESLKNYGAEIWNSPQHHIKRACRLIHSKTWLKLGLDQPANVVSAVCLQL